MNKNIKRIIPAVLIGIIAGVSSCKKSDSLYNGSQNLGDFSDTSGTLKSLVNFPIGMALRADISNSTPAYFNTAKREASWVTFENELKNESILSASGTYNFTAADAFYDKVTAAGLQVYGHVLVWHSQQRASYYTSLIGNSGSSAAPNLVTNGGFEDAATNGDVANNWQALNGATQFALATGSNVNTGSKALQANVPAGGQNYNTQIVTRANIPVTAGKTYTISFYVKAAAAQNIQFEVRPAGGGSVDYQGGKAVTTTYSRITYNYTVPTGATSIQVAFDLGGTANTIYIDDVSVVDANYVPPSSNLVTNGGFENAATNGDVADNWQALNGGTQFAIATGANANTGSRALQANVPAGGQNYNTQIVTRANIPVTAGKKYTISFFAKAATAQNIQFEVRPAGGGSVDYQGGKPITTSYSKISYDYTVPTGATSIQVAFDLGGTANTIYIDDVSVTDPTTSSSNTADAAATVVDNAMKTHIQTVVGHYAGKIKAWDVINEPFTDAGELRNNTNSPPATGVTNQFIWQNYLGEGYAAKAFNYAHATDPNAELYMNDYNLETSTPKLTAYVALANKLKTAGVPINGVGTQVHITYNTPQKGIDDMFKALAATGLKVRITELDVRVNIKDATSFTLTPSISAYQAAMFKYVVASYMKYVPAAQRGGITVWGVNDANNWRNTATRPESAVLFDNNFNKKPAYSGFKQALQGKDLLQY